MKKTNRVLSVLLAAVMMLSAISVSLFASAETPKIFTTPSENMTQGYVTNDGNANAVNAKLLLDFADSALAGIDIDGDIKSVLDAVNAIGIKVNINSIDGILSTIDSVATLNSGWLTSGAVKLAFGYGLVTKNWTKGQTRQKTGDVAVINNLLAFLSDNQEFISAFVADKTRIVSLSTILDKNITDFLKATIAKLIYDYEKFPSDRANYDACVKKSLDAIFSEDVLGEGLNTLLKKADNAIKGFDNESLKPVIADLYSWGFKLEGIMDSYKYNKDGNDKLTLDGTIAKIAEIIYKNNKVYLKKLLYTYGTALQNAIVGTEFGAPFKALLKFDQFKESSDYSFLEFKSKGSITDTNVFVGQIVMGVTTYTGWSNSKNLGANFEALVKWALGKINKTGTPYEKYNFSGDNTQYALALAQMIVNSISTIPADAKKALGEAKSAQEVITKLLPIVVVDTDGTKIVGDKSATWEQVCGDILGYFLSRVTPLYLDANNKVMYQPFSGISIWDVLNAAANYYLVDLNMDTLFGLKLTKDSSFLSKVDALQAVLFGKNLAYTKMSVYIPALINNIFKLDFNNLVRTGIEEAFTNINKTVTAGSLVYTFINNILTAALGKTAFAEKFTTLEAIISTSSIGNAVKALLSGLNTRKAEILPVATYLYTSISSTIKFDIAIGDDAAVTAKYIQKIDGVWKDAYTFKKNTDYKVTVDTNTGIVTVKGLGNYVGNVSAESRCVSHTCNAYKVTKAATCAANGSEILSCVCGKNTSGSAKTIAKGHIISLMLTEKSATCTSKGSQKSSCLVCGGQVTKKETTLSHAYNAYKTTKNPTCSAEGSKYRTCALCNKVDTQKIAKKAHTPGTATVTKKATLKANGTLTAKCKVCGAVAKTETIKLVKTFKLSKTEMTYTGKALKPTVTVKDSAGKTLKNGTDYSVKYSSNTNVGEGKVTVTLKGKYSGTKTLTFKILPKGTSISKLTGNKKAFKAEWKKQATQTTGYEVQYSTSKKFTSKTTKTASVSSAKTTSKTVSKLKAKTTYYVKVRTYKTVKINGKSTKLYSAWSSYKSVKTK